MVTALRELPAAIAVSEAGSVRRRKETFRDLDIIASATNPAELTGHFAELSWVVDVAAHGDTKATVVSREGLRFDLRVVPPESFGNLLQHFTGSKDHNVAMREEAVRRGLSISEYGVTNVETGDVFKSADEDDVYEFLGYEPIPPELRENSGELEAARRGELPKLVELARRPRRPAHALALVGRRQEHARGDARGRGGARLPVLRRHRPLALPPRRPAAGAARGDRRACGSGSRGSRSSPAWRRTSARAARSTSQTRISRCSTGSSRRSTTRPTRVRPSGSSRRCRTRTSTAIGHLTGRRIGKRPPRDVDVERVIEGALETGTLLEINGQPDRLDLRDVHARAAKEAGLQLIVTSDGHEVRSQAYLELAVGAGPARLADEGRRRQHAHVEAARQAAEEAAVAERLPRGRRGGRRVGGELSGAGRRAAGARAGEAGRALGAAAGGRAGAARAVLRGAPRSRRAARCRPSRTGRARASSPTSP